MIAQRIPPTLSLMILTLLISVSVALGISYERGEGVRRDNVPALMWLTLAAAQGNKESEKARDNVSTRMTQGQIAEAQRLAKEGKPTH